MAGFAFQARIYVAELAEALAGSNGELRDTGISLSRPCQTSQNGKLIKISCCFK